MPLQRDNTAATSIGPIGVVPSNAARIGASIIGQQTESAVQAASQLSDFAVRRGEKIAAAKGVEDAQAATFERDAGGNLVAPETPGPDSVYGANYSHAMMVRYGSEVALDMRGKIAKLAIEHQNNPVAFAEVAGQYLKTTVGAVDSRVRGNVELQGREILDGHQNKLLDTQKRRDLDEAKGTGLQVAEGYAQEYQTHALSGTDGTEAGLASRANLDAQLQHMVDAKLIQPHDAKNILLKLNKGVALGKLMRDVDGMGHGDAVRLLDSFKTGAGKEGFKAEWEAVPQAERISIAHTLSQIIGQRETLRRQEEAAKKEAGLFELHGAEAAALAILNSNAANPTGPQQVVSASLMQRINILSAQFNPKAAALLQAHLINAADHAKKLGFEDHYAQLLLANERNLKAGLNPSISGPDLEAFLAGAPASVLARAFSANREAVARWQAGLSGDVKIAAALSHAVKTGNILQHNGDNSRVMEQIIQHNNVDDDGKPAILNWRADPKALAIAEQSVLIGVIPAGAVQAMKHGLLSQDATPQEVKQAIDMFKRIDATIVGSPALRDAFGDERMLKAFDYLAKFSQFSVPGVEALKQAREIVRAEPGEADALLRQVFPGTAEKRKEAIQKAWDGLVGFSFSGVGSEGGRPWYGYGYQRHMIPLSVGGAPPTMRDDWLATMKGLAGNGADADTLPKRAFDAISKKWGYSTYGVAGNYASRGDARYTEYPPEREYALPPTDLAGGPDTKWIAEYVGRLAKADMRLATGTNMGSLELGKTLFLRYVGNNAQGRPAYHVVVAQGDRTEMAYRKDGQVFYVDLAPEFNRRQAEQAPRAQKFSDVREVNADLAADGRTMRIPGMP